jgi:hypothetical protein
VATTATPAPRKSDPGAPPRCKLGPTPAPLLRSIQGRVAVSIEVPNISEPLRSASALTLAASDFTDEIAATDEFKQTMAQRLNGAAAPGGAGLALRAPFPRGAQRVAATSRVI